MVSRVRVRVSTWLPCRLRSDCGGRGWDRDDLLFIHYILRLLRAAVVWRVQGYYYWSCEETRENRNIKKNMAGGERLEVGGCVVQDETRLEQSRGEGEEASLL